MSRVLTFGAFDMLHYGHMRLLQRLAQRGSQLIVGLATDELLAEAKATPFYPFAIRREMLLHTRYVDEVAAHGGTADGSGRVRLVGAKIELVKACAVDEVVMGDDWRGDYDFLLPYCRVAYLPRTPDISTTAIRQALAAR